MSSAVLPVRGGQPVKHTRRADCAPYVTRDGSVIRELMHPDRHGVARQSFAEATVAPGKATALHQHRRSEEIYHVSSGVGLMTLGGEVFPIAPGDTVCIAPGTPHRVENTGDTPLVILCACTPAYSHEDTEVLDSASA